MLRNLSLRATLRAELLEGRDVPAVVANQILVQFQPGVVAADQAAAVATVGGHVTEQVLADAGDGELVLVDLPADAAAASAVTILSDLPVVRYAEPNAALGTQSTIAPTDPYYRSGSLWGMGAADAAPASVYGSGAAKVWATGNTGSQSVYVGVVDEGIDYTHPDLYLNIWLNRGEIPSFVDVAALDLDRDGQLTYRELNDPRNAGQLAAAGHIRDLNGTGYIDAGDVLRPVAAGGWSDGVDGDGNGFADDLAGWNFQANSNQVFDPTGDDHGTHVAGTIGAVGDNGIGVAGVNWSVTIIPAKFLGADGSGSTAAAVKALDYVTNLKLRQGLDVVATNNSWGGGAYSRAMNEAIIREARANILFVAAAGNDGDEFGSGDNDYAPHYPSNYDSRVGTSGVAGAPYDNVISVAALTRAGALATFSNFGARTVDLAAPGERVYSTVPGGQYASYSGTSMATPHVTGAAALYAAANPTATAAAIRAALLNSAAPTPSLFGITVTGGRLDVAAALLTAPVAPTPGPTGTRAAADGGPSHNLTVGGEAGTVALFGPDARGGYDPTPARLTPFAGFTGAVRTAVGDVDGDGVEDTVVVTGPGAPVRFAVVSGKDNFTYLVSPTDPFGGGFTGGGFAAAADLDGDGRAEVVLTPDQGGGPRVVVYSLLPTGLSVRGSFLGIDDANFRGGARAALGDVNGDGTPELVVAAGFGGGPRVAVFDGATVLRTPARLVSDFFAFPGDDAVNLRNGAFVAAGDVDGDGYADLVFGGGPGGAPRVLVLGGKQLAAGNVAGAQAAPVANFFVAGDLSDRGGARVAVKDTDGDGKADVAVGAGPAGRVRVYLGAAAGGTGEPGGFFDLDPFPGAAPADGVYVG